MAKVSFDFNLAPKDAIAYLENKGYKTTFDYDEMMDASHHKSFTVAKVMRHDLLMDIHTSLLDAKKSGVPFLRWQKDLKPTLQKMGWWGNKSIINPATGEVKDIYIGARRLNTIFNTNMRVAHSVQRYQQMRTLSQSVYWRYLSEMLPTGRKTHKKIHGTILHRDDAFWQVNYPPNGWNCRCKVQAFSKKALERRSMKVSSKPPKSVAEPDWAYNVGDTSMLAKMTQLQLGSGLSALKPESSLAGFTEAALKARFYKTLGIKEGGLFVDKVGDPLYVGDELFTDFKTGKSKLKKARRHLYIDELAKTVSDPDKIYMEVENRSGKSKIIKKMFRYFNDEAGNPQAIMGLFTYKKNKTVGTTLHVISNRDVIEAKQPRLVYKK